jgi:hypothetical protein
MLSLLGIAKRNAETFYNFKTGKPHPLWPRYLVISATSAAFAWLYPKSSNDLYTGFITVQAILVGFSFNVMIFLASAKPLASSKDAYIEERMRSDRLNALAPEIFFNLSYFNLIGLASTASALALLMGSAMDWSRFHIGQWSVADEVRNVGTWAILFLLYSTAFESFATFVRIVRRASYYFEQRVYAHSPTPEA